MRPHISDSKTCFLRLGGTPRVFAPSRAPCVYLVPAQPCPVSVLRRLARAITECRIAPSDHLFALSQSVFPFHPPSDFFLGYGFTERGVPSWTTPYSHEYATSRDTPSTVVGPPLPSYSIARARVPRSATVGFTLLFETPRTQTQTSKPTKYVLITPYSRTSFSLAPFLQLFSHVFTTSIYPII